MAVEEKVVIKVEVDADISNDLLGVERRLKSLESRSRAFNRQTRDMDQSVDKVTRRFGKMQRALQGITGVFGKFLTTLSKFSFIALAGQIGLFTAGLLAAKAALVTGRAAVSAYQASLRGLSVVAAGVATAMAVAAAAIREFQEAQLSPFLGGGQAGRSRGATLNRSISARMTGLLGSEATGAITGSFARAGVRGNQSNALARQLFNITGGDAKAAQSLAAAFASGDFTQARSAVRGAAGFRKDSLGGVTSMAGLMSTVAGGGATSDAFQGVAQTMATTMIGTLKTEFAGLKGIFADIGEPLLAPFRESFLQISRILREDIISMTAVLQKFGAESFAPTLVTVVDKISEFLRSNIVNNMGRVEEMGESFVNFFKGVRDFFDAIGGYLVKLEPAADVVIEMFKAMGDAAGGRGLFQQFNALVVENAEAFVQFGTSIGNVFGALFDQLSGGQMGFFNKLPLLSDIFDTLASDVIPALFNVFNQFAPLMERLPGALEGLATVLNMIAPIIGNLVAVVDTLIGAVSSIGGMIPGGGGLGDLLGLGLLYMGGRKLGVFGRGARAVAGGGQAAAGARAARATSRGARASAYGGLLMRQGRAGMGAFRGSRGAGFMGRSRAVTGAMSTATQRAGVTSGAMSGMGRLGKFAKFGKVLGPLGVGLGALDMGMTAMNAYDTGEFTGAGMLSGGLTGATIGSMIMPGVGTVVGAIIGTAVGAVTEGLAAFLGNRRKKEESKKRAEKMLATSDALNLVGAGSEAIAQQQDILTQFQSAMEAGIDEKTGRITDGDTREFNTFLQMLGIDPTSVHRDDLIKKLVEGDFDQDIMDALEEASDFMIEQVNNMASALQMSQEQIMAGLEILGIDPMTDYSERGVAAMLALFDSPQMDRSRLFLPDFSTSEAGVQNRFDSASAVLNTLIGETGEGVFDASTVSDFVDRFAAAEIASGMNADIAGLSGLFELREEIALGNLSPDILEKFNIADMERQVINQIAAAHGLDAASLYQGYVDSGFDIMGLEDTIAGKDKSREMMRSGVLGGNIPDFAGSMGPDMMTAFTEFIIPRLVKNIPMDSIEDIFNFGGEMGAMGAPFASGDLEGIQEYIDANYEGGAEQATRDFMAQVDGSDQEVINKLQEIISNTSQPATFNITGDVSETSTNGAQLLLTIQSVSTDSTSSTSDTSGGRRPHPHSAAAQRN